MLTSSMSSVGHIELQTVTSWILHKCIDFSSGRLLYLEEHGYSQLKLHLIDLLVKVQKKCRFMIKPMYRCKCDTIDNAGFQLKLNETWVYDRLDMQTKCCLNDGFHIWNDVIYRNISGYFKIKPSLWRWGGWRKASLIASQTWTNTYVCHT